MKPVNRTLGTDPRVGLEAPTASPSTRERRRHYPWFTALIAVALVISAITTGTLGEPLSRVMLNALGLAARDVFAGDWERLIVSALVTHGAWVLGRALLWILFAVGAMELRFGTAATALTFWCSHALSVAAVAAGVVVAADGGSVGERLALARDVGPSAGYLACFACVLWSLSGTKRTVALVATGGLLLVLPFAPPLAPVGPLIDFTADLTHLLAFSFGSVVAWVLLRRYPARRPYF